MTPEQDAKFQEELKQAESKKQIDAAVTQTKLTEAANKITELKISINELGQIKWTIPQDGPTACFLFKVLEVAVDTFIRTRVAPPQSGIKKLLNGILPRRIAS